MSGSPTLQSPSRPVCPRPFPRLPAEPSDATQGPWVTSGVNCPVTGCHEPSQGIRRGRFQRGLLIENK